MQTIMSLEPKGLKKLTIGCTFEIVDIIKPTNSDLNGFTQSSAIYKLIKNTEKGDLITVMYNAGALTTPINWYRRIDDIKVIVTNHTKDIQSTNSLGWFKNFFDRIKDCKQL